MKVHRPQSLSHLDWAPVRRALEDSPRIVVTTHVRPDTDGIGSEIALHRWLSRMGHDVRVLNADPLPERLRFLDPEGAVRGVLATDEAFVRRATVVVVDVSERERLGPLAPMVENHAGTTICIDHHVNDGRRFAALNVIEPRASSTGVLVSELLQEAEAPIDAVTATAIYATIVADTGSFRFSNATSEVMRLSADLVDLGAEPQIVHRGVLGTYSRAKLRLLSRTVEGTELGCDGQLAWFAVTRAMLAAADASEADAEGLVEYLRLLEGVRVSLFFVETEPDVVKVSFRSEGIDVNRLARTWSGGGHRHASGATIPGAVNDVVAEVVGRAKATLFA